MCEERSCYAAKAPVATDTFLDAYGQGHIAGVEVSPEIWRAYVDGQTEAWLEGYRAALDEITHEARVRRAGADGDDDMEGTDA